jgi:hypothetical protein
MSHSTPPPANNIEILAVDLLCTHAEPLLRQLAHANWEPAAKLKEACELYSEVRLGVAMANGAAEILSAIDEKAPETERSAFHG